MKRLMLFLLLASPCFALDTPQDACVRKGGGIYFIGPTLRRQVCRTTETQVSILVRKTIQFTSQSQTFRTALVGPPAIAFMHDQFPILLTTEGKTWMASETAPWIETNRAPVPTPIENIANWSNVTYVTTDGDYFSYQPNGSAEGAWILVPHP